MISIKNKKAPELLLPAGSLQKAKFAFAYGADAVYAGVPVFALRAKENMFTIDKVKELVEYAHSIGKKIYLTINIYPHNKKLNSFMDAMEQLVAVGPDAFIVSDPGIIHLIRRRWPLTVNGKSNPKYVELHLSVQQNTINWASAAFWKANGISRCILARELSYEEVCEIVQKNPDMEFEYFVHGAMCIAYSGRCLLSNYLAGRDANQGVCAQSCRWQYKVFKQNTVVGEQNAEKNIQETVKGKQETQTHPLQSNSNYSAPQGNFVVEEQLRPNEFHSIQEDENGTYIMNSRDMCLIDYIPELITSGVCSLKVEGRNKSEYYAAITAKAYREAIDTYVQTGKPADTKKLLEELQTAGNRGFMPGFFAGDLREKSQRYESNKVLQTHIFVGVLKSFDVSTRKATFHVKNRVDVGDDIELITPKKIISHKVTTLFNNCDKDVQSVHPGTGTFSIILDKHVELDSEFVLARREGQQKINKK
ncbi:MAG: U32 family peptidase C-terminal domain-containing protein [Candidatus Nanoarchaeia archaeon]